MTPPKSEKPLFGRREAIENGAFTDWQARAGVGWREECRSIGLDPEFMDDIGQLGLDTIDLVLLTEPGEGIKTIVNAQLRSFLHLGFAMGREYERRHGEQAQDGEAAR